MKLYEPSFQKPLPESFYFLPTELIARKLLGKGLVVNRRIPLGVLITEVEAYLSINDPASHSHRGPTRRNSSMFARGGTCYVYLSYGMHYCMNVVTAPAGIGEAVLIRGALPWFGTEELLANRKKKNLRDLLNGPGKLTQALNIDLSFDGEKFGSERIAIIDLGIDIRPGQIRHSPRIGISRATDLPLRFFIKPDCLERSRGF